MREVIRVRPHRPTPPRRYPRGASPAPQAIRRGVTPGLDAGYTPVKGKVNSHRSKLKGHPHPGGSHPVAQPSHPTPPQGLPVGSGGPIKTTVTPGPNPFKTSPSETLKKRIHQGGDSSFKATSKAVPKVGPHGGGAPPVEAGNSTPTHPDGNPQGGLPVKAPPGGPTVTAAAPPGGHPGGTPRTVGSPIKGPKFRKGPQILQEAIVFRVVRGGTLVFGRIIRPPPGPP